MAYGDDHRCMDHAITDRRQNIHISHIVRSDDGCIVAVLLSGAAGVQEGPASVVVPIDKLSMLVTIAFSWIVFHEKLTKKAALGVICITAGTILLAII